MLKKILNFILIFLIIMTNFVELSKSANESKNLDINQELLDANEVFQNVLSAYQKLDSYHFTNYSKGYDYRTDETKKNITGQGETLGKSIYKTGKEDEHPLVEGNYDVKFKKPYLLQMKLNKTDYTSSIAYGTVVTYRPDKSPENWWAKPRFLPFAIKRSVKNDDAGGFFEMGWAFLLMDMEYYKNNGQMEIKKIEKVQDKECYVLEFDFVPSPSLSPAFNPDLKSWNIPDELKEIVESHKKGIEENNISTFKYWIDKERFVILKTEEYVDGKFREMNEYRDVELNTLTEKNF